MRLTLTESFSAVVIPILKLQKNSKKFCKGSEMYMKKKFITLCVLFGFAATAMTFASPKSEMNYYRYAQDLDQIEVINATELTLEELENRNGKLIIERVVGVVDNAETGEGHVLYEDLFNYISYKSTKGIKNGDVVCSYFIYNPSTNCSDDTIMRFDYIIDNIEN